MAAAEGSALAIGRAAEPSVGRQALRWLGRNPRVTLFGGMIVVLALVALLAPWISPGESEKTVVRERLLSPSRAHPLSTDPLGRDTLNQVFHGARVSLSVAAIAVIIGAAIGTTLACLPATWVGGPTCSSPA